MTTAQALQKDLDKIRGSAENVSTNRAKRALYQEAEALWQKARDVLPEAEAEPLCKAIDDLEDKFLRLTPAQLTKTPFRRGAQRLDMLIRLISSIVYFTLLGMFTFLPMATVIPMIDRVLRSLGWPRHWQLYEMSRKLSSYLFLLLAGVFFTTEGQLPEYDAPVVLLFQHGSNLDGFIILNSFPQYFKSIGKDDIFLMPYVGWMAYIFGILPIDRKHRNDAIKQIGRATDYCKRGVAVALSPEGTRSKTGQLMRFKKGPFYVQHEADAHVVPLVIVGNYELWPPNYLFSCPGQVVLRYLPPIKASELKGKGLAKDSLSREVRKQMFEAIGEICDSDKYQPGAPLTWSLRALNTGAIIIFWTLVCKLWQLVVVVRGALGVTQLQAWMAFIAYSVIVTVSLYYFHCKRPHAARRKLE